LTDSPVEKLHRLCGGENTIRLFLDYDGTLAPFAQAPDVIIPDQEVIALLTRLVGHPNLLTAILSGRSLEHLHRLLPMRGLLLAGTYGIEIELPDGSRHNGVQYEGIHPVMEKLQTRWHRLIEGRHGFFLEDKGWALALHARFADPDEAQIVLNAAHAEISALHPGPGFEVERRERFLELVPVEAQKVHSVEVILKQFSPPGSIPVYIGDDQNDETAFAAVLAAGGVCVRVGRNDIDSQAQVRLESPEQVRSLLAALVNHA